MNPRAVTLRRAARQDIDEAIAFYVESDSRTAAYRFVDEVEASLRHLARHPESGSPRYAQELNLPGLRSWPLPGFPYLVFYVFGDDRVDVWRILHGERDIPGWLRAEGQSTT